MPLICTTCTVSNPDGSVVCVRCGASLGRSTDIAIDPAGSYTVAARPSSDPADRGARRRSGTVAHTAGEDRRVPIDTPPPAAKPASSEPMTIREGFRAATRQPSTHVGGLLPSSDTRSDIVPATAAHVALLGSIRLVVVRGERPGMEYPVLDGRNYIGRSADKPVDIDLDGQEPAERVWASRQHAVVVREAGGLMLEDLNSLNGTFVNRIRVLAGHPKSLTVGDIIQVGTVQLKVVC